MKNCEMSMAVHTPLINDGIVFRTQNKTKQRQERCTFKVCLSCLILHAKGRRKCITKK